MYPEQNKHENRPTTLAEATERTSTEVKKNRRAFGAGVITTLAALGIIHGAQEAPKVIDNISTAVQEQFDPSLPGEISVTVEKGDTLYDIAEEADPNTDPRNIIQQLGEKGVDPASIQPGEIISVPVSAEAEAEHNEQANN